MFRKLLLIPLYLALLTGCASAQPDAVKKAHAATHSIAMVTITGDAGCSATAIGPHALLTASHCEMPTDDISIDGDDPVKIVKIIRDGNDHSILYLDTTFASYAELCDRELEQGDTVFAFGNPGPLHDMLRFGRFAGVKPPSIFGAHQTRLIFDFNVFHGDSGAALFDAVTGKIAGVVTGSVTLGDAPDTMRLTFAWPLAFTHAQIEAARK